MPVKRDPSKPHTAAEKDKTTKPPLVEYDDDEGAASPEITDEMYLSEHGHSTFPEFVAHYLKQHGKKELKQTTIQLKKKAVREPKRAPVPAAAAYIQGPVRGINTYYTLEEKPIPQQRWFKAGKTA